MLDVRSLFVFLLGCLAVLSLMIILMSKVIDACLLCYAG